MTPSRLGMGLCTTSWQTEKELSVSEKKIYIYSMYVFRHIYIYTHMNTDSHSSVIILAPCQSATLWCPLCGQDAHRHPCSVVCFAPWVHDILRLCIAFTWALDSSSTLAIAKAARWRARAARRYWQERAGIEILHSSQVPGREVDRYRVCRSLLVDRRR